MYKLSQAVILPLRIALKIFCVYLLLLISNTSYAGAGHNHGHEHNEVTKPAVAALPRVTMESSQFELVGILQDKDLHLYLDDYNSNQPINNASLELELAGERLQAKAEDEGGYHIVLKETLKEGVYPILVTVIAQQGTDLLTGELDVHHNDEATDKAEEKPSPLSLVATAVHPSWIVLISLSLLLIFGFVLWRDRQKRGIAE